MKPTAPLTRLHEHPDAFDREERRNFETALVRALRKSTHLHNHLPSEHIEAWRTYQRQWMYAGGGPKKPQHQGYHLWSDSSRLLRTANGLLTSEARRKEARVTLKTVPRRALALVAEAIGYRYMQGLELFEAELTGLDLAKFRNERRAFLAEFNRCADTAHGRNGKGEDPGAVLAVLCMFREELLALCPWLELAGQAIGADALRESATLEVCEGPINACNGAHWLTFLL